MCVYDLLVQLARIGIGCFIGRKFVGALAYADDIVLVASTASALRKMLAVCDNYATEYYMALLYYYRVLRAICCQPVDGSLVCFM